MRKTAIAATALAVAVGAAGCGSTSSSSSSKSKPATTANGTVAHDTTPAGDIPDNQAYVTFAVPGAGYSIKVPEGWAQTSGGGAVSFSDKLNSIRLEGAPAKAALTVAGAKQTELPRLAQTVKGYKAGTVTAVPRGGGTAIRITYLADGKPDPVTGKSHTIAVERYVYFKGGRRAIVTLSGDKRADNVDPWKIVSGSVRVK